MAEELNEKAKRWEYWHTELEQARKAKGFDNWQNRAKRILERYRDERTDASNDSDAAQSSRFNILWSNIQTLRPALLGKVPKPVVERRYLDKDDVGRTASVILERALSYEIDDGSFLSSLRKGVDDRLLPGRGVVWLRYEPKFTPMPGKTQESREDATPAGDDYDKDAPAPEVQEATSDAPQEQVADESVPVDYIDWRDFMTSPSRTWEEVWWIAKRVYMTRNELVARFGDIGKLVTLDWTPIGPNSSTPGAPVTEQKEASCAKVWEFWNKRTQKVCWIAESYKESILDEKDDPLQLEGFWPVPKPLYATLTNDSLIPVPDYVEYQDQADELDDLTGRISSLTKAIKVAGVYDASQPEIKRMFEEGFENELVPCDNMAEFSQKAGANGMGHLWLLPLKDMAATLLVLYQAREGVKQSLYEITGISDIVRGQATEGAKTATEQRIKGQFASMRLNDMQAEVARFARDTLRIMGEIISEHFDPMTLFEISGFEEYAKEQWPPDVPSPPMAPQMPNGGPPAPGPPPAGSPGMGVASPQPPAGLTPMMGPDPQMLAQMKAKQKAAEMFKKAIELLRNDKLRGFRIDIETDSLVEPDQQATQEARTQLMGAISQFLPQAIEAGQASPELRPLLARLLMFFLRGFKASRDIESAFEQFIDDLTKQAANPQPKPPSPEEIKAQAEMAKQKAETDRMMLQAKIDAEKGQADMAMQQQKMQFEREKMEAEYMHAQRMLQLKEREAMLNIGVKQQQAAIDSEAQQRDAQIDEQAAFRDQDLADRDAERDAQAAERQSELAIQTAETVAKAKAANAKKPEARK